MSVNPLEWIAATWFDHATSGIRVAKAMHGKVDDGALRMFDKHFPENIRLVQTLNAAELLTFLAFSLLAWNIFKGWRVAAVLKDNIEAEKRVRDRLQDGGYVEPSAKARFGWITLKEVMCPLFVGATFQWWLIASSSSSYETVKLIYSDISRYYWIESYAWCMFFYTFVVTVVLLYYVVLVFSPLKLSGCCNRCGLFCEKHDASTLVKTPISYETAYAFYSDFRPYFEFFPVFLLLGVGLATFAVGGSLISLCSTVLCAVVPAMLSKR